MTTYFKESQSMLVEKSQIQKTGYCKIPLNEARTGKTYFFMRKQITVSVGPRGMGW